MLNDDTFPDGTHVKKGSLVAYSPWAMGRMQYIWGSDACDFKPERWMKDGVVQLESPFKFTAFQVGKYLHISFHELISTQKCLVYRLSLRLNPKL